MTELTISKLQLSTILYLYSKRAEIQLDPEYQRASEIWTLEKRQLLIDSILNGYDVPKLYFHKFPQSRTQRGHLLKYAIIDGKQRLESMWGFIDNRFPLGDDVETPGGAKAPVAGLTYADLSRKHPDLKLRFDSYPLDIVSIETDDIELIEDMFSRLNEAVPLSAAEKRNAFGGPLPPAIRQVAKHAFFTDALPFANTRYRHFDLAAKFLYFEKHGRVVDTKKVYLDAFVRDWPKKGKNDAQELRHRVSALLDRMRPVFAASDPLLRVVGMTIVYFHGFKCAVLGGWERDISRDRLLEFEQRRQDNRKLAERDLARANYDLIEFDRYLQSPNDAYATSFRLTIFLREAFGRKVPKAYAKD